MTEPTPWSDTELKMLNTMDVFIHKPAIISKTEKGFHELKNHLGTHIASQDWVFPDGVDLVKGQIAKGENHKGFPFVSLDLPQFFTKDTFYTFRVLFWWGHYLGFSLILKGDPAKDALPSITKRMTEPEFTEIHFARSASPWEWELGKENFAELKTLEESQVQMQADTHGYIKLLRYFPMKDPAFQTLDWNALGTDSLNRMMSLIRD